MKNNSNITLIILTVTALILGAMLIGLKSEPTAYAAGAVKEDNWVLINAQVSKNVDGLVIIDNNTHTMKMYLPDMNNKKNVIIKDSVDLEAAFKD